MLKIFQGFLRLLYVRPKTKTKRKKETKTRHVLNILACSFSSSSEIPHSVVFPKFSSRKKKSHYFCGIFKSLILAGAHLLDENKILLIFLKIIFLCPTPVLGFQTDGHFQASHKFKLTLRLNCFFKASVLCPSLGFYTKPIPECIITNVFQSGHYIWHWYQQTSNFIASEPLNSVVIIKNYHADLF